MRKDIKYVVWKKCIDFNGELRCPECNTWLYPVCVNLGMVGKKFYCTHKFPKNCKEFGCPKYHYVRWVELETYRLTGRI